MDDLNPFSFDFREPEPCEEVVEPNPAPACGPLISAPGAYPDIEIADYHGREICPAPSISSTGLKRLVPFTELQSKGHSPRHYWEGSPLNPNRKPQEQSDALRIGSAFHDALLLPERWADPRFYHFLPEGFSRAAKVKQADEIAAADTAASLGRCLISVDERSHIEAMVKAMRSHPAANAVLSNGAAETTLAWQDAETGVWLRCRPDWLPKARHIGINVKSTKDASYVGFQKDVTNFRYAMSAALEMDGIAAVYGKAPGNYLHPVVEKPGTNWQPGDYLPVALWELPPADIEMGRALNRRAIRIFADCLSADRWPGYADEPSYCGMSSWAHRIIDKAIEAEGV
tara:strand:+ start:3429 stop:4457 length:1029 start_codon:yes stop_codon:yes gene_type:complete